jgi:hypothetical protein
LSANDIENLIPGSQQLRPQPYRQHLAGSLRSPQHRQQQLADHLGYLGLTPEEIAGATLTADGLTEYFTINSANVDILSALWEQLLLALNFN